MELRATTSRQYQQQQQQQQKLRQQQERQRALRRQRRRQRRQQQYYDSCTSDCLKICLGLVTSMISTGLWLWYIGDRSLLFWIKRQQQQHDPNLSSTVITTTTSRLPSRRKDAPWQKATDAVPEAVDAQDDATMMALLLSSTSHRNHGKQQQQQQQQQQLFHPDEEIPRRLVFTYKWNLLEYPEPRHVYENVLHTIDTYRQYWKQIDARDAPQQQQQQPNMQVVFLDDVDCLYHIESTAPFLKQLFLQETDGSYKSDICRAAFLVRYGGYYFDVDMQVVQPFVAPPGVQFVTVKDAARENFFQSFLATTAQNFILKRSLHETGFYYAEGLRKEDERIVLLGPYTLQQAFDKEEGEQNPGNNAVVSSSSSSLSSSSTSLMKRHVSILQEINLEEVPHKYTHIPRREGEGCCCNYAVVKDETVYFYSRIVGAGKNCNFPLQQ